MWSVATLALLGAEGFRVKTRKGASTKGAEPPQIAGVFPFGSPGPAKPPLVNHRGGPCFPGKRFWTAEGRWTDFAVTVTGAIGYAHPYLDGLDIDLKDGSTVDYPCGTRDSNVHNLPTGLPWDFHNWRIYVNGSEHLSDLIDVLGNLGVRESFTLEADEAAKSAAKYGWELAGSAVDPGNDYYVGRQVSHLFQHPSTKECILTFMGSMSVQDWSANFAVLSSKFCGLVSEDADPDNETANLMPGESWVHTGFRDCLREMVQNEDWQTNVRSKLPTCSKVYVTGHSLGGAQAELFAACVQKAPQPGEPGYEEDYKFLSW